MMIGVRIEKVEASAYTIPTDQPEADGTMHWDSTTLVVVESPVAARQASVILTRTALLCR
jgi:hypothetical protein